MSEPYLEQIITRAAEQAAKQAAEMAVAKVRSEECGRCGLCVGPEFAARHELHHEQLDEFLKFLQQWNEAKWSGIRAVVAALGLGLVFAFLWFFFGIKEP